MTDMDTYSVSAGASAKTTASSDEILKQVFANGKDLYESFISEKRIVLDAPNVNYGNSDPLTSGTFAVFITTPDLNLSDRAMTYLSSNNPFVNRGVISCFTQKQNFIRLLYNSVKNAPFADITLDTNEYGDNFDGAKITLPKSTVNSRQSNTVSLHFAEYASGAVTNSISFWINYIDGITKGHIEPLKSMVDNKIIDYACSIYVFALLPDYMTITHAAKYTGAFPISIPGTYASQEVGQSEIKTLDIPFAYSYYEYNTAAVIEDFNISARGGAASPSLEFASLRGGRGTFKGERAYLTFNTSGPFISPTRPVGTAS